MLTFTGTTRAVADAPPDAPRERDPRWVDDPYGPHDTTGANLRLGSAVGHLVHDGKSYTALGAALAFGPRIGRFTFEGDFLYLSLTEPGPSNLHYGSVQRLGAMARVDLVRLGSHVLGANSMLALYGEIGGARQWHQWSRPGAHDPARAIPVDSAATIGVVGFGINLDHRFEKPLGFPSRVGWQLGWQLTSTPTRASDPMVICRGPTCAAAPSEPSTIGRNTALLVTSTMAFTW
ncbi:MAG: hypothetical protein IPL61_26325 [Myxococcales bacterium]|nr:hypothetical protein [Myxococcales bacterium]